MPPPNCTLDYKATSLNFLCSVQGRKREKERERQRGRQGPVKNGFSSSSIVHSFVPSSETARHSFRHHTILHPFPILLHPPPPPPPLPLRGEVAFFVVPRARGPRHFKQTPLFALSFPLLLLSPLAKLSPLFFLSESAARKIFKASSGRFVCLPPNRRPFTPLLFRGPLALASRSVPSRGTTRSSPGPPPDVRGKSR